MSDMKLSKIISEKDLTFMLDRRADKLRDIVTCAGMTRGGIKRDSLVRLFRLNREIGIILDMLPLIVETYEDKEDE